MIILRIEHRIANYDGWKKAFDNDPIDRKKSGVTQYHIYRPTDDENFVIIDLEFASLEEAQATKTRLEALWPRIEGTVVFGAQAKLLNVVESIQL